MDNLYSLVGQKKNDNIFYAMSEKIKSTLNQFAHLPKLLYELNACA